MSEADNAGREGGIGARLQAARTRRGLTPSQAAERLHVDPMVIDALENERFATLGASVYVRGHLRRYAELLGEPAGELQQLYAHSSHSGALPDLTRIAQAERPPADRRRFYVPGVAVLIAFGIAGAVWWVVTDLRVPRRPPQAVGADVSPMVAGRAGPVGLANSKSAKSATSLPSPASPVVGAAAPASSPPAGADAASATPAVAASTASGAPATAAPMPAVGAAGAPNAAGGAMPAAPMAVAPHADPGALDTLSPDARMGAAPPAPAAAVRTAAATPASAALVPAAASDAGAKKRDVRLTLRMNADSWVEVYDAAGKRLYYDVVAAEGVQRLAGAGPLRVVLGNPPGVALEVNGRAVTLPEGLRRAETVQFVVEPSGRLVRTRGGADGG